MIQARHTPGGLELRGHAGYAPAGADIVCAAVSILAETLARSLPSGSSRQGSGFAMFRFPEDSPQARFVLLGLRLLAESYPEAISLTESLTGS